MTYKIDGVDVKAEEVTEGSLTLAKSFLPAAEIGQWVVSLPDRTVMLMEKAQLDKLAVE